jgi:hypothetical protein
MRYVRYLEASAVAVAEQASAAEGRDVEPDMTGAEVALHRAAWVHCKRRPEMHLFAARFEERAGDIEAARNSYERVLTELAPNLLAVRSRICLSMDTPNLPALRACARRCRLLSPTAATRPRPSKRRGKSTRVEAPPNAAAFLSCVRLCAQECVWACSSRVVRCRAGCGSGGPGGRGGFRVLGWPRGDWGRGHVCPFCVFLLLLLATQPFLLLCFCFLV